MGTAECVEEMGSFVREFGITDIASSGLPPGVEPDFMAANLDRLANNLLPSVRAALA